MKRRAKTGQKKNPPSSTRSSRRSPRITRALGRSISGKPSLLRIQVRAPKVHVTTPAPKLTVTSPTPTVQVEAPSVHVEAPKPLVIPAPIVNVEVEAEENPDLASIKALRKELSKCQKQNQTVELLLSADFGADRRHFRVGQLLRVDEGIVALQTQSSEEKQGMTVLIPLNQIVAIIPELPMA